MLKPYLSDSGFYRFAGRLICTCYTAIGRSRALFMDGMGYHGRADEHCFGSAIFQL